MRPQQHDGHRRRGKGTTTFRRARRTRAAYESSMDSACTRAAHTQHAVHVREQRTDIGRQRCVCAQQMRSQVVEIYVQQQLHHVLPTHLRSEPRALNSFQHGQSEQHTVVLLRVQSNIAPHKATTASTQDSNIWQMITDTLAECATNGWLWFSPHL